MLNFRVIELSPKPQLNLIHFNPVSCGRDRSLTRYGMVWYTRELPGTENLHYLSVVIRCNPVLDQCDGHKS